MPAQYVLCDVGSKIEKTVRRISGVKVLSTVIPTCWLQTLLTLKESAYSQNKMHLQLAFRKQKPHILCYVDSKILLILEHFIQHCENCTIEIKFVYTKIQASIF
jgi:hypothetical protein